VGEAVTAAIRAERRLPAVHVERDENRKETHMRTGCGHALVVGLLLAGLLSGCATTVGRQESVGLPTAENPEYLGHPFRLVALPLHATGNILRYGLVEPFYFLMNTMPDFVGLSLEEQQHLRDRQDTWAHWYKANIADYNPPAK